MADAFKLKHAYEKGREQWPGVELSAEEFARHLSTRLPAAGGMGALEEEEEEEEEELELSDLYLACACALRVPGAVEALEHHYLVRLPQKLKHLRQPEEVVEEVCQQLRIHLLVGMAGAPLRIAEYTGRGKLLSWLQVIAARMVFKRMGASREEPEENVLEALETLTAPERGAELGLIKQHYQREFRQALERGIQHAARRAETPAAAAPCVQADASADGLDLQGDTAYHPPPAGARL